MPRGLVRFHNSGQSHFITFSCRHRQPKFVNGAVYRLFEICLEDMRRRFPMRVYGNVVMPEHVHLLISEPERGTLADALHYLKLSFAKRLRGKHATQVSVQNRDANLTQSQVSVQNRDANLTQSQVSVQNRDANLTQTQVSVQNRDANLTQSQVSVQNRDANLGHKEDSGSFWEKRYHDRNVRNAHEFSVKLRYLHRNPVKRGLVTEPGEWKWSSFRHYAYREIGIVEIESEWTARDREREKLGGPPRIFLSPS